MGRTGEVKKNVTKICLAAAALLLIAVTGVQSSDWTFGVLCDSRSSYLSDPGGATSPYYDGTVNISPYFKNVAAALANNATALDFVLFIGDMVAGKKLGADKHDASVSELASSLASWNAQWKPVSDKLPVYSIRGNHDANGNLACGISAGADVWRAHEAVPVGTTADLTVSQSGLTYSFSHKGSIFIGLDEYADGSTAYDQVFLRQELAKDAAHRFVFGHQPIWNYKNDELIKGNLAADLQTGNADLYMAGHIHSYQRIKKSGYRFQELIVGIAGAPQDNPTLQPSDPGYVADPSLSVLATAGGTETNAKFGWVEITVHDNGTVTSVLKVLSDPTNANSGLTTFDEADITADPIL